MGEALEIHKRLLEMAGRARGEVQLANYQGLPLQEAAATSQVKALSLATSWIAKQYHIRRCYECGEYVQLPAPVDGLVWCPLCHESGGPLPDLQDHDQEADPDA